MIEKYFFPANMVLMVILGIRDVYLGSKLVGYLREKHPDKAAYLGCNTGSIRYTVWLHKKEETTDTELLLLKTKARNARDIVASVVFVSAMFWILYLFAVVIPGR